MIYHLIPKQSNYMSFHLPLKPTTIVLKRICGHQFFFAFFFPIITFFLVQTPIIFHLIMIHMMNSIIVLVKQVLQHISWIKLSIKHNSETPKKLECQIPYLESLRKTQNKCKAYSWNWWNKNLRLMWVPLLVSWSTSTGSMKMHEGQISYF